MDLDLLQQINSQLREMNDLIGRQNAAMSAQLKSITDSTNASNSKKSTTGNLNNAQKESGNQAAGQTKISEISRQAALKTSEASDQLSSALASGKAAFLGLANALLDVTPGFSKYTQGIESATDAVAGVTSIFGPLGAVAGGLLKGFSLLVGETLKYNDNLVDAYDSFAKAGAGVGLSAEQITELGRSANLSSGTLKYLSKNIEGLGTDLRALGFTSSQGAEKFSRMVAVGDENLKKYRNLGYTQEELIDSMATYVQLQSMAGADLKKTPEQLQKASLKYLDELNAFAEVTGINKKRQEEALEKAMAQENFNAYITRLNADLKNASSAEEKAQLESEIKAKTNFAKYVAATYKGAKAAALLEAASSRGAAIMTAETSKLKAAGIDIEGITKNLSNGVDQVGELRKQDAEAAKRHLENFKDLTYAYGQDSRNINENFLQDNETREAARRYFSEKEGKDQKAYDAKTQAAMAQQEAVKKKIDGLVAQKADIEKQERDLRLAFDEVLTQMSPILNSFLTKALPWITGTISFVTNNFDKIVTASKILAGFFGALGAIAIGGKILGALSTASGMVAGLFGRKTGELGSSGNPMYASIDGSGPGGPTSKDSKSGKKGGRFGKALKGAGKVALAGAGIAAAGWMASSAIDAFDNEPEPDQVGDEALAAAGVDISAMQPSKPEEAAKPGEPKEKPDPVKMEQSLKILKELGKANIDPKKVEANSEAIVALPKAMSGLPEHVSGGNLGPLSEIVGNTTIIKDLEYFSNQIKLNPKQTKDNAEAFSYFSNAIASFKGFGSPLGVIGKSLADASIKFFEVDPPLDQFTYFSKLPIDPKRTKTNAGAFVSFSEAMAKYTGGQGLLSAVSTIAGAKLNSLFGQDSAIDSFVTFSQKPFGKYAESNSKAFLNFSKAMNILSGGNGGLLDDLANAAATAGSAAVGFIGGAATAVGQALGIIPGPDAKAMNFIGKIESGGDYNKLVGGKSKTDPPLTSMTVAEVMAFQSRMKSMGHESTALGKYQIIRGTLAGLVQSGKISPSAKFDQATQDNAALALMKARGRDKFREGKMPADSYANNLAKEWASLPMPDGRSFYAGTGSNKSLVSRADFVNSLKARTGGLFKGPTGGYPVELHGTELIIPVTPDSILTKLMEDTPDAGKMTNDIFGAVSNALGGNTNNNEIDELVELDNQMKEMLLSKITKMLDVLDTKQTTSTKILKTKLA